MARITVEDCLRKVPNKFELIILASKRAKQLFAGATPLVETTNREIITALREVAAGKVRKARRGMSQIGGYRAEALVPTSPSH
jgi:DNA-directed RNA polymerase subunit omega